MTYGITAKRSPRVQVAKPHHVMRPCCTCRYYRTTLGSEPRCVWQTTLVTEVSPVTLKETTDYYPRRTCESMRNNTKQDSLCRNAYLWEPIPTIYKEAK